MNISISVAASPSNMPQIMFVGELEKHFQALSALGYEGIDLFFPQPYMVDLKAIKRSLHANNLRVTMLASQGDIMADGLFLNDPACRARLLERARYHLEQCATLNTRPNIGFLRGKHGADAAQSLKHMAEGVAAYCELAKSFAVDVLLEPICRYEINSVNTTAQALELCELAGNPSNLSLLLDLFHMNIEEASLCGAIGQAGSRIGHMHFVDNTRAVPGMGCLPLKDIVATLNTVDYQGFLGIEAIPGAAPMDEARHGLAHVRGLLV